MILGERELNVLYYQNKVINCVSIGRGMTGDKIKHDVGPKASKNRKKMQKPSRSLVWRFPCEYTGQAVMKAWTSPAKGGHQDHWCRRFRVQFILGWHTSLEEWTQGRTSKHTASEMKRVFLGALSKGWLGVQCLLHAIGQEATRTLEDEERIGMGHLGATEHGSSWTLC